MNIAVFCEMTACILVKMYYCLEGIHCLHLFNLKTEALGYSETLLHFCQTARRYLLEDILKIR